MRVLLLGPDQPTDPAAPGLARGLADAGLTVTVVTTADPPSDRREDGLTVLGWRRDDPHPTHWMREGSVEVTRRLREVLRELAPDVVHVTDWTGLTNDPVLTAARAGIPGVVELSDHRATCLLGTRRRPEDGAACERTYGPYECVSCAAQVPPVPTWVAPDRAYMAFGERAAALGRELALARARLVPDEAHGEALVRALGTPLGPLLVAPPAAHPDRVSFHLDLYRRVVELGPPAGDEVGEETWFEERMRAAGEQAWDEGARAAGLDPG